MSYFIRKLSCVAPFWLEIKVQMDRHDAITMPPSYLNTLVTKATLGNLSNKVKLNPLNAHFMYLTSAIIIRPIFVSVVYYYIFKDGYLLLSKNAITICFVKPVQKRKQVRR